MKYLRHTVLVSLFILFFIPLSVDAANVSAPATNIDMQKQWTIHFNQNYDKHTINATTVYILNNQGVKLNVSYQHSTDGRSVTILPPTTGYIPEQTYTLVITSGVKNTDQKALAALIEKPFTIKSVDKALVITNAAAITNLYTDPALTSVVSYVAASSSFELESIHEKALGIRVAGVIRYIPHEKATVTEDLSTQSYYQISGNALRHYVYNHTKKQMESYSTGAAPDFLQTGVRYTSSDGATFKNPVGQVVGESYKYFQYLSVRTKSAYTGEQLNSYINKELARRNIKNSKLTGIGTYLKEIEAQYDINALFLLAFAQHESAFGTSANAQKYNNLFGIKIYDSGEQSDNYDTPQESVVAVVKDYLNTKYIPADAGANANGVATGNKFVGFNVKYASDPYWGAKIAGFMYTIDQELGGKDYKQYKIGLIKETPDNRLNIRPTASASIKVLYFIRNPLGKPLTIVSEATAPWLQVLNDQSSAIPAFASGDFVRIVDTH